MRHPKHRHLGFTLLETMVALAILSVALMAIFDLNSGAVANHVYTKRLTVASLLARSKMTDLEQKLYDDGFDADDDEQSGDFSDDGWPQFKWRARIIAPKTDGVTPDQLIGAIFNLPMGGGDSGDPMGGLGGLFGGGASGSGKGSTPPGGTTTASPMGASAMSMAQPMFTQMVDQLTKSVREVHLTVYWKEGTQVESLDVVTHVVSLGPGGDRNGGFTPNAGSTAGAENQWVDENGRVVDNPIPGPNGQMLDPNTRRPLRNRAQVLNELNGAAGQQQQGNGGFNPRPPGGIFGGGGRGTFPGLPGRGGIQ